MYAQYYALRSKYPNAELVVTGHSLGGAIAQHALVHLKKVSHSNKFKREESKLISFTLTEAQE